MRQVVIGLVIVVCGVAFADEIPVANSKVQAGTFSGRASYVPWSGIWWPMAEGRLARGWNGTECFTYSSTTKSYTVKSGIPVNDRSPLLKYDEFVRLAAGTDPQSAIHELHGSGNFHHHVYGDQKAQYDADDVDYSWWGHCNGWSAAASLEAEPFCPIEARGIRFDVADLKGLLTESYFGCAADFTGSRYNAPEPAQKQSYTKAKELLAALDAGTPPAASQYRAWYEAAFDTTLSQNYTPAAYRDALEYYIEYYDEEFTKAYEDIRPDVFHKILVTIIGQQKGVVVFDISANESVWNYPAYVYETEITAKPNRTIDGTTRKVFEARTVVHYADDGVSESILGTRSFTKTYTYELYTTLYGYLRGGRWLGQSVDNHPDFAWYPKYNATGADSSENARLLYSRIKEILPAHHESKDAATFELSANGTPSSEKRGANSPITWASPVTTGAHVTLAVETSLTNVAAVKYFTEQVIVGTGFIKAKRAALTPVGQGLSTVVTLGSGKRMIVAHAYDASGRLLAIDEITVNVP